jgi:hypothetical protein
LTRLQLNELLINVLPMRTNLLGIVHSHIETSKETLRDKVENTLFLAGGTVPRDADGPREEEGGS